MELRIQSFKMHNNTNCWVVIQPTLEPLHLPGNVFLKPMLPILTLLIHRGALQEHGAEGKVVESMHQLFTSEASEIIGVGDMPLFLVKNRDGSISEMSLSNACCHLAVHTSAVGLPGASYHSLQHNFAQQMQIMFNADTAHMLITHKFHQNTLEAHYTDNIAMFNLMGLCAGERAGKDLELKLQQPCYY